VPSWTRCVFFAAYDPHAAWFDELRPAFGQKQFFFEKKYDELMGQSDFVSGQMSFEE
jgi:hypothetical protein